MDPVIVHKLGIVTIVLYQGDITHVPSQAIANAANSSLLGGGGVDGAIHRAAGHSLHVECRKLYDEGGCPTGEARITTGGHLPADYVVHTVGPVWHGGERNEAQLLADCYTNSIELAKQNDIQSLIFPSISTGIFGYPIEEAARTAKKAVEQSLKEPGPIKQLGWCLFDSRTFDIYRKVWS